MNRRDIFQMSTMTLFPKMHCVHNTEVEAVCQRRRLFNVKSLWDAGSYGTTLWAMTYLKLLCYFAPFCVA